MDVKDKLIVISGAASGIGEACAQHFHALGAKLALIDLNESIHQIASELDAHPILADVSNAEVLEAKLDQTFNKLGPASIAISCAGIAPAKRIVGRDGPQSLDDFSKVINVNLIGTFNVMRLTAASMMNHETTTGERGVIINTASIAAYEGQIGQAAYSASKGGVVSLTIQAAREFAQFGIRVNTIAPGLIATPLLLNMPKEVQESLAASVPFPKRLGKPEEFAKLAAHIVENEMINGEVIRLDGALRMASK